MALATRISPAVSAVANSHMRVATFGRASAAARVEDMAGSGAAWLGYPEHFAPSSQGDPAAEFGDGRGGRRPRHRELTPLLARFSLGFSASESAQHGDGGRIALSTEMLYGVGAYERTMRVIATAASAAGGTFNRLY